MDETETKPDETQKVSMNWPAALWKAVGRRATRNRRSATAEVLVIVEERMAAEAKGAT